MLVHEQPCEEVHVLSHSLFLSLCVVAKTSVFSFNILKNFSFEFFIDYDRPHGNGDQYTDNDVVAGVVTFVLGDASLLLLVIIPLNPR
jgi:hypothetical protein